MGTWHRNNAEYRAGWARRNREKIRLYSWRTNLKRRYRLTEGQYDALMSLSGGKCMICGQPRKRRRLSVDHCHRTQSVRGLLCDRCNAGIEWYLTRRKEVERYVSNRFQLRIKSLLERTGDK